MEERFVCISCWREFVVSSNDIALRAGKAVCPSCGYIQPFPSQLKIPATPISQPSRFAADPDPEKGAIKSRGALSAADGVSGGELDTWTGVDENEWTDQFEAEPDIPEDAETVPGLVVSEPVTDEVDAVTPRHGLNTEAGLLVVREWHLKTPTGLTFKFNDPESLLVWKKKLGTYKTLTVSPDGARWVDFATYVRHFEESGDAVMAFLVSEREIAGNNEEAEASSNVIKSGQDSIANLKSGNGKTVSSVPDEDPTSPSPQFTFMVKEEEESNWGKRFLLAVVGLGIGAAVVLSVLYVLGIWNPFPS